MRLRRSLGPIVAVAVLLGGAFVVMYWLPGPAAAQLGGSSEVTQLELKYRPSDDAVEARFHLATGLALTDTPSSRAAADRLFEAARVLASGNARLFVSARNDRVVSWHLSVP